MIIVLTLGIILFMMLGFNSIDRIGKEIHKDSLKGSFYEITKRKRK